MYRFKPCMEYVKHGSSSRSTSNQWAKVASNLKWSINKEGFKSFCGLDYGSSWLLSAWFRHWCSVLSLTVVTCVDHGEGIFKSERERKGVASNVVMSDLHGVDDQHPKPGMRTDSSHSSPVTQLTNKAGGEYNVYGNESGKLNSPPIGNIPSPMSFANLVNGDSRRKTVNFHPLFTPAKNGVDLYVSKESVSVVNDRFNNKVYGFFLGKRMAYHVVENYVKNTWTKFGLGKSMKIKDVFFFKFGSKDMMEAMLESDPWLIRNVPLILKQWTPDANIMKDDVFNIPVWVKFHDVPITAFTEDGLSVIATKLSNPLMLDSYTAAMCIDSWGRASYTRAMVELKDDVELRDTIVVVVPKFSGRGGNQTPSTNSTPVVARINDLERQMLDGKLVTVDDHGKPLKMEVELPNDETSRYMSSTIGGRGLFEDDLDCYDGYEAQVYDLPEQMQTFCDQFGIRLRSRVRK
ncbi:zinc knuckle CX2CX4HX4C containing protein [Tanacetum coccineum]|uniref:Zinc knuckle CX2CX4HX4C containing protein n=1 Tax=Tanacetum coccineum TaxID=301880 RepID=A0ABQ5FE18_9ASTR